MRVRSKGALALGIFFGAATAAILFWDVRSLADISPDHALTLGTLLGTISAGHYLVPALKQRNLLAALGLAIAFAAGTFVCVAGSAGRGGEAIQQRAATASKANEQRQDAREELKKARARRDELDQQMIRECATGRGTRCQGLKTSIEYADSHIAILQVRADAAPAAQIANVKLAKAAEVVARFVARPQTEIEKDLTLLWPFAQAVMWELLTITFLSLGLGHRTVAQGHAAETQRATALPVHSQPFRSSFPRLALPDLRQETHPVIAALEQANRPVANFELAGLMDCSPGEASKRCREVADQLRVVRQGKRFAIELRR